MQFSKVVVALITSAVAVSAAPASGKAATMADLKVQAQSTIKALQDDGCDTLKCIASLAGDTAACGAAAAQAGLDPLADVACFASVGSTVANDACSGCF
ncbi:hypothetical protein BGW36DRAFT_425743 [Talaromyces proteolyticus]|uniref:Fungal calcium binding protein domain-containing protein n=1 Tax=Talaromyces proteolyticus TaxID=1131652 RepID=A0AAD4Q318_9EURO|nr:uncharacterized protein BGW36DRAFT_425743 [Talaromyces proteolyticus]KAH8700943.1 hypothetical protein BGW36DRAFT_425743 [Talaromyces proteolyticus]